MRQSSSITFTDGDSHNHVAIVRYPEQLCFSDSAKCRVDVRLVDTLPQPGDRSEQILITVKENGANNGYSEVRVRNTGDWAYFDIARYVQMILGDIDPLGTFDYSGESELVPQKVIQVTLSAFGTDFFTGTFNTVHGNNKVTDKWWSSLRRIRWWPAYPFALDLPNTQMTVTNENGGVGSFTPDVQTSLSFTRVRTRLTAISNHHLVTRIRVAKGGISFGIAKSTDTGHVEGTKLLKDDANSVNFFADKCPADPNAAYLRWLDRHCELRHWLFSRHHEADTVKATEDRRAGFDPDRIDDGVLQDGRLWDGVLTKELTVNTGYLQGWEYELVESIINAPFVDMLDMDEYLADGTIIWHRLTVKPGSYTRQLRNAHSTDHNHQLAVTLQYDGERSVGV